MMVSSISCIYKGRNGTGKVHDTTMRLNVSVRNIINDRIHMHFALSDATTNLLYGGMSTGPKKLWVSFTPKIYHVFIYMVVKASMLPCRITSVGYRQQHDTRLNAYLFRILTCRQQLFLAPNFLVT